MEILPVMSFSMSTISFGLPEQDGGLISTSSFLQQLDNIGKSNPRARTNTPTSNAIDELFPTAPKITNPNPMSPKTSPILIANTFRVSYTERNFCKFAGRI